MLLRFSDGREAAVDRQLHPIHEARIVRSKKQRDRRNFLRTTHLSRGIRDSNIRFASSVRTWSCIGVAIGPGLSTFTRIFLPFSSLSQVRANERNAALLAEYTP